MACPRRYTDRADFEVSRGYIGFMVYDSPAGFGVTGGFNTCCYVLFNSSLSSPVLVSLTRLLKPSQEDCMIFLSNNARSPQAKTPKDKKTKSKDKQEKSPKLSKEKEAGSKTQKERSVKKRPRDGVAAEAEEEDIEDAGDVDKTNGKREVNGTKKKKKEETSSEDGVVSNGAAATKVQVRHSTSIPTSRFPGL